MAYRITYDTFKMKRVIKRKIGAGIWLVTAAIISVCFFANRKTDFLLPGDPQVTSAALEQFAEDLQTGQGLSDAVTAFCQHIIENAQ